MYSDQMFRLCLVFILLIGSCISVSGQLPMKVARTLSFKTTEGTNMDVDVSSDGNTLAFTMVGEIFTMPAKGGFAKQLTKGLALKSKPVWSPDGKMIAYTSDASGGPKIHVMDRSGKAVAFKRIGKIGEISDEIRWTSVGDSVLRYAPNKTLRKAIDSLAVKLGEHGNNFNNVRISNNGRWLLYLKGNLHRTYTDSLMILDLKTQQTRLLTRLNVKSLTYLLQQRYCFSPDSKSIYIGYGGKIHRIRLEGGQNEVVPFNVDVKVDMAELNHNRYRVSLDSFEVKYMRDMQLRPDGKQLAFVAMNQVYVQDLPNGKPRILNVQPFGQFHPRYSPDGKWIVYVSWEDDLKGHVWYVPVSGGMPQQLTKVAENYRNPIWSPDGKWIVVLNAGEGYDAHFGESSSIQLINLEDKFVKDVLDKVPGLNALSFTKNGNALSYTAVGKDGKPYLALRRLDGLSEPVITAEESVFNLRDGLLNVQRSAETGHIIYSSFESLYLVVPRVGQETTVLKEKDFQHHTTIRFSRMGIDAHWEDEGKTIAWNYANRYYRVEAEKIIDAAKQLKEKDGQHFVDVVVKPSMVIEVNLEQVPQYGKNLIALTNARIMTMGKTGVIDKGSVIVGNGRIISVGNVDIPKEAKVIDLNGRTIIPGFIDLHDHIGFRSHIFPAQHWRYQAALAYGTTTSRNPAANYEAFGHQELLGSGIWVGPRLYHVGNAVRDRYSLTSQSEADSVAMSRAVMGGISIKQYTQPTRVKRERLALAAAKYKLNLTNEDASLVETIGMLRDGSFGVEHMKIPEEFRCDVLEVFARSGSVWTPAFMGGSSLSLDIMKGYFLYKFPINESDTSIGANLLRTNFKSRLDNWAKRYEREILKHPLFFEKFKAGAKILPAIMKAGGLIGVGSHGEISGIGMHYEMWALQMGGMSNAQVLEAATLTGAKALGLERDLGSIEKGKIADLLVLDANPLEDIHNTNTIRYIMKAGVLYDQKTLMEVDLGQLSKDTKLN